MFILNEKPALAETCLLAALQFTPCYPLSGCDFERLRFDGELIYIPYLWRQTIRRHGDTCAQEDEELSCWFILPTYQSPPCFRLTFHLAAQREEDLLGAFDVLLSTPEQRWLYQRLRENPRLPPDLPCLSAEPVISQNRSASARRPFLNQ